MWFMLVKATPGVKWFQDDVWDSENHTFRDGIQVRFLPSRIKFTDIQGRDIDPAPFDSMFLMIGSSCYCQSYINNRQI
jgi:hypothetical protein